MPIGLLLNVCLGLVFATCARDRLRADGPFGFPAFPLVIVFAAIVVVPAVFYLYLAHPAWSWMYFIDPASVPVLILVPLLTVQAGAVVGAFYIGGRLIRAGHDRHLRHTVWAAPVVVLIAIALAWGRLGRYGTYADFRESRALPIMDVKLGYVLVGMLVGVLAAAGFTAVELLRDGRRVRTR